MALPWTCARVLGATEQFVVAPDIGFCSFNTYLQINPITARIAQFPIFLSNLWYVSLCSILLWPLSQQTLQQATDPDRRHNSQYFILRTLEEDIVKNPNDARTLLYLARTQMELQNYTESMKWYGEMAQRLQSPNDIYHGLVSYHHCFYILRSQTHTQFFSLCRS